MIKHILLILISFFLSCKGQNKNTAKVEDKPIEKEYTSTETSNIEFNSDAQTIHIIVSLCDNKYQGIVPVPANIGNGQDPKNNLYWGTAFGIKTYFKRSSDWSLIKQTNIDDKILERIVFKHKTKDYYIVADAYNGKHIKQATETFLRSSAGIVKDTIKIKNKILGIKGNSKLVAYIGHDGLMDFSLNEKFVNTDNQKRDVIILACYSKSYFKSHLELANVNPLVWTTGLMAPEAYTIHDAITGYVNNESNEAIRLRAAKAYNKYQKCGLNASKRLLVTGN